MSTRGVGIEGRLDIRLSPRQGEVSIRSSRPLLASRLFEGKSIDMTLKTLPLLFNVCGQAQHTAAIRAIESALDTPAAADVERARDRLVRLETLREHLWRILLDWPRFSGGPAATHLFSAATKLIGQATRAIDPGRSLCGRPAPSFDHATVSDTSLHGAPLVDWVATRVFGEHPAGWLQRDGAGLEDWSERTRTPAADLLRHVRRQGWEDLGDADTAALPDLPAALLIDRLDAADADTFVAAPTLNGQVSDTGPLARCAGHPMIADLQRRHGRGLLVRLAARLIEVAECALPPAQAGRTAIDADTAPGLAQLEAARGRLCHRVLLDGERIRRYRILAPTEWNFHPRGAATQALRAITATDPVVARAQAELLVHAIDPCVGYNLTLEDA